MDSLRIRPSWLLAVPAVLVALVTFTLAGVASASQAPAAHSGSSSSGVLAAFGVLMFAIAGLSRKREPRAPLRGRGWVTSRTGRR